jgi:tetratricopeptide (TPR) repeat protein
MAWVMMLLCPLSSVAQSQQADADVLVAQAVLAYDAGNYDQALDLLKRALEFDAKNPRGLYYTGLTYLALKQPEQAVAPLETLRGLRPSDVPTQYQLGVAYFTLNNYEKAAPLLEQAFQAKPELDNLGYYVGFTRYRLKDYPRAVQAFDANKTSDPNVLQLVYFYKGLSLGYLGLSQQAKAELEAAQRVQAVSPISGPAIRMQEVLAAQQPSGEPKRLRLQISLGGYYDDNVAVNPRPSADPVAESFRNRTTNSPGGLASLYADYAFIREGGFETSASYSFFQTYNINSGNTANDNIGPDKFNMQNHQGGLNTFYRGTVGALPYQFGAQYTYDYLFLDQAGFLSRHSATGSATLVEPTIGLPLLGSMGNMTTALARYQLKDFFREPVAADIRFAPEQRDGFNTMFGVLHVFRFAQDRVLIRAGYQYDNEATKGSSFSYLGHRIQSGAQVTLPWGDINVRYDYDMHFRTYREPQALFVDSAGTQGQKREDIESSHLIQITKPLPNNFAVTAQFQHIRNDSNIPVYNYAKNVGTLLVTWSY